MKHRPFRQLVALAALGAATCLLPADADAQDGYTRPELLVDTAWLAGHLDDPGVRVVDVRRSGYEASHVPGAVWLDINTTRDADNPPTFLPPRDAFERAMRERGISAGTRVVVYDDRGAIYASRLWFILNYFGHTNVALLDGGWTKWTSESRPVAAEPPAVPPGTFRAGPGNGWIATADDVRAAIGRPGTKLVDARTQAEIEGRELRNIKRGGHIPGAVPLYWEDFLDPELKTFKPAAELRALVRSHGLTPADAIITYCQVALRASHDLFTLYLLGFDNVRNYYGAWQEWGNRDDTPITRP